MIIKRPIRGKNLNWAACINTAYENYSGLWEAIKVFVKQAPTHAKLPSV
jgi:hypothetical protein